MRTNGTAAGVVGLALTVLLGAAATPAAPGGDPQPTSLARRVVNTSR